MINHHQNILQQQDEDQSTINIANKMSIQTNLFNITKFVHQTGKINAIFTITFKYFLPILLFIDILPPNYLASMPNLSKEISDYSTIFYTIFAIIKFTIIVVLVALYQQTVFKSQIVMEILKLLKSKLRILIEIDFHFSMSFCVTSNPISFINCLLSILLCLFSCIYVQNYINKQDLFYSSSCRLSFIFKMIIVVGYFIVFLESIKASNILINTLLVNYTILIAIWFYKHGYLTYPKSLLRVDTILFISLIMSSIALKIQKELSTTSENMQSFIVKLILTFVTIAFCNYKIVEGKITNFKDQSDQIKQLINYIQDDQRKSVFILGRIQIHQQKCTNLMCTLHDIDLDKQRNNLEQDCIEKSYFRCLYQQEIARREQKNQLLLQYCEYLYSQNNRNPYKMSLVFYKITPQKLNIFNRSSFYDLKRNIEQMFQCKVNNLYQGKMHFQQLILFQQNIQTIRRKIHNLVSSNIEIYQRLSNNEIDLNIIFQEVKGNRVLQAQLNSKWLQIGNKIKYRKLFTIIYFFYRQLIKNQSISRKDFIVANLQQDSNKYRQSTSILINNYYNNSSSTIYQHSTMVFTSYLHHQKLLFKNISLHFIYLMKFNKEQLLSESIDIILPDQLKQAHGQSFSQWFKQIIKPQFVQSKYLIKDGECLTKDGQIIKVAKYFKCYVDNRSTLQFICMLKTSDSTFNKQLSQQKQNKKQQVFTLSSQYQTQYAIFIKEQQLQPKLKFKHITIIKIIIFTYLILIAITIFTFHLVTINKSQKLQSYSEQYITFMQCYRIPMILGNNYLSSFLNIGNKTKIATQIISLRQKFIQLQSSQTIIKTLYDGAINTAQLYYPYKNLPLDKFFDQIQIFYIISKSISSLNAPVNRYSQDFQIFDQFITPAYDNMLNNTKRKFHQSFLTYINEIKYIHIIILSCQICLSLIFFILLIKNIISFKDKMNLIGRAISNFSQEDISHIQTYWMQSKEAFRQLFSQYTRQKSKFNPLGSQLLLSKKIIQSKNQKKGIKKIIAKFSIGMIALITCLLATQFSLSNQLNYLIYFQNEGYIFLKFFPTATIVGYGCLSKYYNLNYPIQTTFDPNRFEVVLGAMKLVGQFPFVAQVKDNNSDYFKKQKNYFFGNPCRYNPSVIKSIGVTLQKCQSIINGSFNEGLRNYMHNGYELANNYIFGQTLMNSDQLNQFSMSVSVLSAYILDAITTWGKLFNTNLQNLINKQYLFTIINSLVLLSITVIVFTFMVVGYLQRQYQFYRYLFMKMIPSFILKKDKVLRQIFINSQILQ